MILSWKFAMMSHFYSFRQMFIHKGQLNFKGGENRLFSLRESGVQTRNMAVAFFLKILFTMLVHNRILKI